MNTFVKYILKIVLVLIVSAYALDFVFSSIYTHFQPYTKAQFIHSLKNQKFDYIFIGSSRVENSVIPEIIEQKTNKKVLNLGIKALKLKDMLFIIKLLKEYNVTYERIFVQVDYSYNFQEDYSKFYSSELLPYANSANKEMDTYLAATNSNYFFLKNIPFLKYSNSEQLIGFRKIFLSSLKSRNSFEKSKGYFPLYNVSTLEIQKMPTFIIESNKYQVEIDNLAKKEKLNIQYFSTPVSLNTSNLNFFEKLKKNIPSLINLHNVIADEKYFSDNCHLNNDGAVAFTNILIEKLKL
ncbi:MAG: hypothetical protein V4666_07180 [Bacteroidota bacterium]